MKEETLFDWDNKKNIKGRIQPQTDMETGEINSPLKSTQSGGDIILMEEKLELVKWKKNMKT